MLTLHKVSEKIKTIIKWGGILIISLTLVALITGVGKNIKEFFAPTPPPPPTVAFGILPNILFPESKIKGSFSYSLRTVTGLLPTFSDRTYVYKIQEPNVNLLALERARNMASQVGFESLETRLSETLYEWTSQKPPFRKLVIDTLSFDFTLSSQFFSDPKVLTSENLPDEQTAVEIAQTFLLDISSFPEDIDQSKTKTTLFSIQGNQLTPATSLSQAHVIRVDFSQKNIDKLPIFYPYYPNSIISVFIGGGQTEEDQVVEAHFSYKKKGSTSGTYPIKKAQEGFKELQSGNAYIASYNGTGNQIVIREVFLGYFLSDKNQDYIIPIIIFAGDEGFFAYVSAIKGEWIVK